MRTHLRFSAVVSFLLLSLSLNAATLRGTVRTSAGESLPGATVTVDALRSVQTDAAGAFTLDVPTGTYTLRVTLDGFREESRRLATGQDVSITLTPALSETMVVSGIRADESIPVTKTTMSRPEIEQRYAGQDIPLLLRDMPSINAYAESGAGGAGYSYFSLRGLGPTRINFTMDGVPLSDSEDMTTYFVDFPDLARSLESVQIQRGTGTSTVGSPSFGGSVNFESIAIASSPRVEADLGGGSFGNQQGTVAFHTGQFANGFALYSRISFLESDGFRNNSATEQRNVFLSASKQFERSQLKLTGFSAQERQQLSFYAADEETLRNDIRNNPLTPEEDDRFGYDLAQVQYIRAIDESADMTVSAYYQRGYGAYRLYDYSTDEPVLQEYGLDGMLLGSIVTYSRTSGPFKTQYGLHVNRFKRDHTRDRLDLGHPVTRDYANYGVKTEANAFAKVNWDRDRLHLYGDAQLRHAGFDYHGDIDIAPIDWTFFNPKAGARYDLSPRSSVYASIGLSTREPARSDLFLGQDNPTAPHDLRAIQAERLYDVEAGWDVRTARASLAATLYSMHFRNEIAATGEINEIGLFLRRNVDRSSRVGLELDGTWQVLPSLRFRTTANVSRNRIDRWTQFFDVYDEAGEWAGSRPVEFRNVQPLLTPSVIVNQSADYTHSPRLTLGVTGRWVGRSYLDNTNSDDFAVPAYATFDLSASYALTGALRLALQVYNAAGSDRIYASGYSYQFMSESGSSESFGGTAYYYPQATRNAVLLLQWRP